MIVDDDDDDGDDGDGDDSEYDVNHNISLRSNFHGSLLAEQ